MAAVNDNTSAAGATLHYVFDPMCGWCYAAAPLVEAVRNVPGLKVEFHGGGMMTGTNRRAITPQWRDYVMPHDRRIAELTGQPFGEGYFDGLLRDTGAVMDSEPPTTAVLAAEALREGAGLDMIHRLQRAHYVEGRRIADADVLGALATDLGCDADAFASAFSRLAGEATSEHIAASRRLLQRAGGQGFPTFVLAQADGTASRIDIGPWLGRAEEWKAQLARLVVPSPATTTMAAGAGPMSCGPDSCAA
ncbi:DsbA-like thioredoxin domain-containing protein [Variovorax paradoxus B4]|uniref:DsbA-like thioredoxin domain-containing protein n=1 Tax=Variovorax paradoxus B4 TaxID=1246301 RepID=T1X8S4_VARPD|nr:DsbA family protein [Variovorax paradoxus]AGU48948.1 DsbA-like thioredoxin domain-containing protein [Variovorax paradoxus B4]